METFFNTEKYDKLYNCSYYSEDLIPEAQKKHVLFGLGMVAFYCVCMFLYVPCLLAIAFSSLIRRSSYQLMMFLGINHICGLSACALSAGLLSIFGVEFCQRPTIVYFVGTLGLLSWCGSTMTSFVLGVNRCCELDSSVTAERFFGGNRKYFWLVVLTLYAISPTIYTMPPIYDPIMMSAFFNPHHAYFNDDGAIYYNLFHLANNVFVCVAHTGVYIVFISLYLKRVRAAQKKVIRDRNTYIQIISIGLIHFIASILCSPFYISDIQQQY
ncbi:unnamed protein product [Bursaphelenchus okinawaensis]|uniref:7TM_GPCR_Srx domain-containing protein n=1 Tax=Bursaphelenchus okinawaensis TaxID=465554 RepID=A0A811KZ11_9BILA|nr:unnamed protein product [Bursaphelenchus okinawaensis]CAG9114128.1 unnamed protein product [Bursaphelenchus okinawaensis]